MKSIKGKRLTGILTVFGVALILGAVLLMVVSTAGQNSAMGKNREIVGEIYSLIPEVQNGVFDDRVNMQMPMLEIDGANFAGVIDIPVHGTLLPIYGAWDKNKVSSFPCRYSGSIYDGSLIIGGSDNEGQFDFMKWITGGDSVFVTDMTGSRYSYEVTEIVKTKDVSTENLASEEADLVLFARNTYSLDYTVVRCSRSGK